MAQPNTDALLDNSTVNQGYDGSSQGQILAQLKIIAFLLREGLAVNVRDEDITLMKQYPTPQQENKMQPTGLIQNITKVNDGSTNIQFRQGNQGSAITDNLHGTYYEQAYRGNMYHVANQAAVSTTAALATTWTGLAISNPSGSGVNAVINYFTCTQFAVGAAGAVGIMTGSGAAAGTLVPRPSIIGGVAGKVTASAGATIATPVLDITVGQVGSLATTGYGLVIGVTFDLQGSLIIPPGFYAASYTTVATTTALIFGFQWEEIPV